MNIKMTTNSQLSRTESKTNKANNQNRNRTTEMELTWRVINRGVGGGEWWESYRE